ncbi:MAG: PHP domain-containing protein [Erysipelotrichaceae bacterium]|nr:PHP domain-containing protein [Erysipelotrichaceae bacterium]
MNKKLVIDLHTHTIASGHAYGTIEENALAAKQKGLVGLGISDHAPGVDPRTDLQSFAALKDVPRIIHGVNIYYGVENNVTNEGTMTLEESLLEALDYCIVGIHGTCYETRDAEENTVNLLKCMAHPKTFFVSHPDDGYFPLDYERLVLGAKKYGVALEVNSSHVKNPWRMGTLENIRIYVPLCMKYRVPIFVGSDAHEPGQVGEFSEAVALLEEMGFDEDLIINNDEDKFRSFIKFKE